MNRFIVIIIILTLGASLCHTETYRADGTVYGKVQGKTREPVLVVDTVQFNSDSTTTIVLNSRPSKTKADVSGDVLLVSATQQNVGTARSEINTYVLHKQKGDTLTIMSSKASDTATVVLFLLVL